MEFGRKYTVRGELIGPVGALRVLAVWIQEIGHEDIKLVTVRPEMKFALLETVVLNRDLPEHGLRAGDLGAVVELYGPDGVEVEFVRASGETKALVTLKTTDLRAVAATDVLAVRAS